MTLIRNLFPNLYIWRYHSFNQLIPLITELFRASKELFKRELIYFERSITVENYPLYLFIGCIKWFIDQSS